MLASYLLEKFGYNEPIFINDLIVPGMSENAIRQAVKRLTASGYLKRYDTGIYYIPKPSKLLDAGYLDPRIVIMRKYIKDEREVYGYLAGISFANELGLTTQISSVIEVVTNKEATKGRLVSIGGQNIRVKRAAMEITADNAGILQFLDAVSVVDKYSELDKPAMITQLKKYIRQCRFTKKQLSEVMSAITGSTAKKLIEWGIIYEFA